MSGSYPNTFDPNDFIIVDNYHTDIEVSFTSNGWDIHISQDTPNSSQSGRHISLKKGLLYGNSDAHISSIPGGFEFTGAEAGQELWVLPQNAYNNTLPLGFAAEMSDSYSLCQWDP